MPAHLFTEEEKKQIVEAIKKAELNTSGEIQVHIEKHCEYDVLHRAADVFDMLKMYKTADRNAVLFYLAVEDHRFAIWGDVAINNRVPDGFWDEIKDEMRENFKQGKFSKGLVEGILKAGEQLKVHFPYQSDDVNELSDEISFGK
jgi:uncharacterized membrane protein